MEQFDTHCTPKQEHCHGNWGQRGFCNREEQGKCKEDAKCSSNLSVSKRASSQIREWLRPKWQKCYSEHQTLYVKVWAQDYSQMCYTVPGLCIRTVSSVSKHHSIWQEMSRALRTWDICAFWEYGNEATLGVHLERLHCAWFSLQEQFPLKIVYVR